MIDTSLETPIYNAKLLMKDKGLAISDEQYFTKFDGKPSIPVALCPFNNLSCFQTNVSMT